MDSKRKPLATIYSDLHLNLWPKFNSDNRRLQNAIDVIDVVSKVSEKYKIPKIFLGDLIHKEDYISNEMLEYLLPYMAKYFGGSYDELTYAISGNHDQSRQNLIGDESPSYIKTFAKTFDRLVCKDFDKFTLGNHIFHCVPYITNDLGLIPYIKSLVTHKKKGKKYILLLHTTLPTARDTDEREVHSNLEPNEFLKATDKFDLVLSGHIHKPEMIIKNYMYSIGAPQQQRATDRNCNMGYWILYDDLKMEFIHLDQYPIFKYYEDPKEVKDDGNFWIRKTQKIKNTEVELDLNSDINNNNITKVAKKYCKFKKVKDKRKIKALEKVLKDVL